MNRPRWPVLVVLTLMLAGIGLRVAAALRPGLWSDEIFSLAMATGHSLEHPAAAADSALGDFVEPRPARSPAEFRRYTEHDAPPAGPGRVTRAVLLSDTSPPLYYLILNGWTRPFGTSDAALRLFSVLCAVLTLPLFWLLGRELGQPRVVWSAWLLFSFSHVAIYNSAEGRMYAFLWVVGLALAWLTLRLSRRPDHRAIAVGWVLTGAAGLLTHYFFAFVWLACAGWLFVFARRGSRGRMAVLAALTLLAVLPWYAEVPMSLARWRVTAGWQDGRLEWPRDLATPFHNAAGLLSGKSPYGGWRWADRFTLGIFVVAAVWIVRLRAIRRLFRPRPLLLWAWLAASCVGLLAFDVVLRSTTSLIGRYVLAALPAAMLLAALLLGRLPRRLHLLALGAILIAWLPGAYASATGTPRPSQPYRRVDAGLESWARPGDVVLVHSIPSGVVGIARYLERDIPVASWVVQLGAREMPADLEALLTDRRRVALVKIHYLGQPAPAEAWLQAHARLVTRETFPFSSAEVLYFEPSEGTTFFAGAPSGRPQSATGR